MFKSPRSSYPLFLLLTGSLLGACGDNLPTEGDEPDGGAVIPDAPASPRAVAPARVEVGLVDCGGRAQTSLPIANAGGAPLTYRIETRDPRVTIARPSGTIAPGGRAEVEIAVELPAGVSAGDDFVAELDLGTNDGAAHVVELTFQARGAEIEIAPVMIGVGQSPIGVRLERSFTVANRGNAPADVRIALPSGELAGAFGSGGLAELAAGAELTGRVTYLPSDLGIDRASAPITIDGVVCGAPLTALALEGEGVLAGGVLVQGGPVDFGTVTCDGTSDTAPITLVNQSSAAVPFTATLTEGLTSVWVAPGAGEIPAGGSVVLELVRTDARGSEPALEAGALRITTTVGSAGAYTYEVPVRQKIETALVRMSQPDYPAMLGFQFGHVAPGQSRTQPARFANRGDRPTDVRMTFSNSHFSGTPLVAVAASTPGGPPAIADGTVTYAAPDGPEAYDSGFLTVTFEGSCQHPETYLVEAGHGARPRFTPAAPNHYACPPPSHVTAAMTVTNDGEETMNVRCIPVPAGSASLSFEEDTLSPGESTELVALRPSAGLGAGRFEVTIRCYTTELFSVPRDLVLAGVIGDENGTCTPE